MPSMRQVCVECSCIADAFCIGCLRDERLFCCCERNFWKYVKISDSEQAGFRLVKTLEAIRKESTVEGLK